MEHGKIIAEIGVEITAAAINYFSKLLNSEPKNTNIRMAVINPGTSYADLRVAFCLPGLEELADFAIECDNFTIFIEERSLPLLQGAKIDYLLEDGEEQLAVKAPNLKNIQEDNRTLAEKIELVIENEINPILAGHGGMIALAKLIDNSVALLRFGGGCKGCSVADVTFVQLVESMLKQHFPELTEIRNITDHTEYLI